MLRTPALAALLIAVTACAPHVGGDSDARATGASRAPWPRILPLSALAGPDIAPGAAMEPGLRLSARSAALRRRARALSARPVLPVTERARLLAAIARHGG